MPIVLTHNYINKLIILSNFTQCKKSIKHIVLFHKQTAFYVILNSFTDSFLLNLGKHIKILNNVKRFNEILPKLIETQSQ